MRRKANSLRRVIPIAVAMACTFACTTENKTRNYDIPDPLCGNEIDSALYEPLFPPGDEIEVFDYYNIVSSGELSPTGECFAEVDGEQAIFIDMFPGESTTTDSSDLVHYANNIMGVSGTYSLQDAEQIDESPRETWVWSDFVVASAVCESSSNDFSNIFMSVKLDWVGDDDYRDSLRELIDPLVDEQLNRIGDRACTPAT